MFLKCVAQLHFHALSLLAGVCYGKESHAHELEKAELCSFGKVIKMCRGQAVGS